MHHPWDVLRFVAGKAGKGGSYRHLHAIGQRWWPWRLGGGCGWEPPSCVGKLKREEEIKPLLVDDVTECLTDRQNNRAQRARVVFFPGLAGTCCCTSFPLQRARIERGSPAALGKGRDGKGPGSGGECVCVPGKPCFSTTGATRRKSRSNHQKAVPAHGQIQIKFQQSSMPDSNAQMRGQGREEPGWERNARPRDDDRHALSFPCPGRTMPARWQQRNHQGQSLAIPRHMAHHTPHHARGWAAVVVLVVGGGGRGKQGIKAPRFRDTLGAFCEAHRFQRGCLPPTPSQPFIHPSQSKVNKPALI